MTDTPHYDIDADKAAMAVSEPVIIVGRGGSGTRLVSKMVQSQGLFFGNDINESADSVEWVKQIYDLAVKAVSQGIEVGSGHDLNWQDKIHLQAMLILRRGGIPPDGLWGWKLPETTLVISQIIRYFPKARFIHLIRHPVSSCCRRTHMTSRLDNPVGKAVLPASYNMIGRDPELIKEDPPHIHNAASWVFQVENAQRAFKTLRDKTRLFEIRFEALVENPNQALKDIHQFLDLSHAQFKSVDNVDRNRAQNTIYIKEDVNDVWRICSQLARRLGYERPDI